MSTYDLTIAPGWGAENEYRRFTDAEDLCTFVVSYLNDEFNENPKPNETADALYGAFAALYAGMSKPGDFSFIFQGECYFIQKGVQP